MPLTAKLGAVLVCVFCSLFVGGPRNIKQAVDARLHGICTLITELKRLLSVICIFVDGFVDQILYCRNILRCAELDQSVESGKESFRAITSRILFSMADLAPVSAS